MSALIDLGVAINVLLAAPASMAVFVACLAWFNIRLQEHILTRIVGTAFAIATLAALSIAAVMFETGVHHVHHSLGTWFSVGHYHFVWHVLIDDLSLPFAVFTPALVGLISMFSRRYLHREPGFLRFYLLLAIFGTGVEIVILASDLDLLFFGWELVGITSALLIAFFHERADPVRHGLRAFITYRICDVGLLSAAVWLHHTDHGSDFVMTSAGGWAGLPVPSHTPDLIIVGLLILWAAMGKSAQVPLSGWLPRAMEGPTPSSAIFYGALSIHLGAYMLLRAAPLLHQSVVVSTAVVIIGTLTAVHGTWVGRVQTDIKSALAYASITQVGLIFVEIGFGFNTLALIHMFGHMSIRSLQILRAPSLLHDYHNLERAMGSHIPRTGEHLERWVPQRLQPWLYRFALERFYFDSWLKDHVVGRLMRVVLMIDPDEHTEATTVPISIASHGHAAPSSTVGDTSC